MKRLEASDWMMLLFSVPLGGLGGAIVGPLVATIVVGVFGGGMDGVLAGGLLGGLSGLVAGPVLVARRWRDRHPFEPGARQRSTPLIILIDSVQPPASLLERSANLFGGIDAAISRVGFSHVG